MRGNKIHCRAHSFFWWGRVSSKLLTLHYENGYVSAKKQADYIYLQSLFNLRVSWNEDFHLEIKPLEEKKGTGDMIRLSRLHECKKKKKNTQAGCSKVHTKKADFFLSSS